MKDVRVWLHNMKDQRDVEMHPNMHLRRYNHLNQIIFTNTNYS